MTLEIQQIVIRANATDKESTDKKKSGHNECDEEKEAQKSQGMMDMISEVMKNKKER